MHKLSILPQREDSSEFLTKFTQCDICVYQSSLVYCSALPAAIQAIHLNIMTHTQHCYGLAAINATIKHTQVPNPRTAYVIIINCTFPYEVFHSKISGTLLKSVEKNGKVFHLVVGLTHVLMTKQGLLTTFPHNDLGPYFPEKHSQYLICYQRSRMHANSNIMHCGTLCPFQVPPKLLCCRIKRILSLESTFTVTPLWLDSYLRLLTQTHSQ